MVGGTYLPSDYWHGNTSLNIQSSMKLQHGKQTSWLLGIGTVERSLSRTHSRQNNVVEQQVTKSLKNTAVDILVKCSFQSWLVCKINYCLLFFVYFNTTTSLKLFYYKPDYLQNVVQFTLFFQSFLKITLFFQSLKWCLYDFWSYFALAKLF